MIKNIIKSVCPPVLWKGISKTFSNSPNQNNLIFHANGTVLLPNGILFNFRPNEELDFVVCNQIFIKKVYDLKWLKRFNEIMNLYENLSNPLIIDLGANIGASSVWFASQFPKAKIIALEPEQNNFNLLNKNSKGISSIIPIHGAISSVSGEVYLNDPNLGPLGFRTSNIPEKNSFTVKSFTIEEILLMEKRGNPFILKVDIEGAEEDLFSRDSIVFDYFPLIIIELHDWLLPKSGSSKNFLKWHLEKNRDFIYIGENVFSISYNFSYSSSSNSC